MREVNLRKQPNQLDVLRDFVRKYATQFPAFYQLILVLIATHANTSPVERGYTFLEMVASKRCNHLKPENLETLFLLAAFKLPVKKVRYLEA